MTEAQAATMIELLQAMLYQLASIQLNGRPM